MKRGRRNVCVLTMPHRIQRKRVKGWKAPDGAVYVGRPSKWGNPFELQPGESRADNIQRFERFIRSRLDSQPDYLEPLRGKDLMCWCRLEEECHADVLLRLSNK